MYSNLNIKCRIQINTSPQNHPRTNYSRQRSIAIKPRFKSSVKFKKIDCRFSDKKQLVDFAVVKELDEETNLYYYGARYLDPRTSRWIAGDPAIWQGDYIPVAPVNDEARKHNQNLPGTGGVFNTVNMHAYHYAGNNPVKYVDPTGRHFEYTIVGDTITIYVDIILYGSEATEEIAQIYRDGIENAWGGAWTTYINGTRYTVNFNVNISIDNEMTCEPPNVLSTKGSKNYIRPDSSIPSSNVPASHVILGFRGSWRSQGRNGLSLTEDNPAAHEFGHLLGFRDRYRDGNALPGWEGNIMAEPAMHGVVEQRNIDIISRFILQRAGSNPNITRRELIRTAFLRY